MTRRQSHRAISKERRRGDKIVLWLSPFELEDFGAKQLGSNTFITGPGRYRKAGKKSRNDSGKFAGRNSATVKSYDQKTEQRVLK